MTNENVILLDGGMGQELVRRAATPPTTLWSSQALLDEPEIVEQLHVDFIKAGSSVITLNAYTATEQRLSRDLDASLFQSLQLKAQEVAKAARAKAKQDDDKEVSIAGCLPPLSGSYHSQFAPDFETCVASYKDIVAIQQDCVDVFLCETMSSIKEATAALTAAKPSGKPVWVALSVADDNGQKLRSGEELSNALSALVEGEADAILLNCSTPEAITEGLKLVAETNIPFGAYANAFTSAADLKIGGTVDGLSARTDLGPTAYAEHACAWLDAGATIIGGCCEVGPDHILEISRQIAARGLHITGA